jgi:RNase P/RNase MRP subunit POP5
VILEAHPELSKNRVVWFNGSLIVRTDHVRRREMELSLSMKVGDTALVTRGVSGSISKLKRLVGP